MAPAVKIIISNIRIDSVVSNLCFLIRKHIYYICDTYYTYIYHTKIFLFRRSFTGQHSKRFSIMTAEKGFIALEGKRQHVNNITIVCLTAVLVGLSGFAIFEYVQIMSLKNQVTDIQIKESVSYFVQPQSVQKVFIKYLFIEKEYSCF